jgi:hypothetical protein
MMSTTNTLRWGLRGKSIFAGAALTLCLASIEGSGHADSCPAFKHPGVMVTQAQLDFVKAKVAAGAAPWKPAFDAATADPHALLTYVAHPPLAAPATDVTPATQDGIVLCGSVSDPDVHCTDEKDDSVAAYTHALLWAIGGDEAHAKKAVEILNAWSILKEHGFSNAPLQSGWTGTEFARAAEIIRYTYSQGWARADVDKFAAMLRTAFVARILAALPSLVTKGQNAYGQNGNWALSYSDALMQIAVFTDDRALFNLAVDLWRQRTPAYSYLTSDGPTPVVPPGGYVGTASGYSPTPTRTADPYGYFGQAARKLVDGVSQETCRDFEHIQYGMAGMINAAETARIQGVDLYSEQAKRIVAFLEFHAPFESQASTVYQPTPIAANITIPSGDPLMCPDANGVGTFKLLGAASLGHFPMQPTWEIAYNEFANRLGMSLPNTKALVMKYRAPSLPMNWIGAHHHMAWETLTHAEIGSVGLP